MGLGLFIFGVVLTFGIVAHYCVGARWPTGALFMQNITLWWACPWTLSVAAVQAGGLQHGGTRAGSLVAARAPTASDSQSSGALWLCVIGLIGIFANSRAIRAASYAAIGEGEKAEAATNDALQQHPQLTAEGYANEPGFNATERQKLANLMLNWVPRLRHARASCRKSVSHSGMRLPRARLERVLLHVARVIARPPESHSARRAVVRYTHSRLVQFCVSVGMAILV